MHDKIIRELDFDKVVVQREFAEEMLTDPATKHDFQDKKNAKGNGNGNSDYVSDFDHPLDLSFTKDINAGKRVSGGAGYASDKQLPSDSDIDDSISLSEESIARKID